MTGRPHQHLYNAKWNRMSKAFRLKHPLCVYCLQIGKTTPAEVVDHIQRHNGDLKLFNDPNNLQALCKACHDSVKAKEEARGYLKMKLLINALLFVWCLAAGYALVVMGFCF